MFELFEVHQGGTFLPVELQSPDYAFGQEKIPMLSASATRAADGSADLLEVKLPAKSVVVLALK